jgi:hypothetical protein
MSETWTPKSEQPEEWTENAIRARVFDPAVFDPSVFDALRSGAWTASNEQSETWTAA